MSATSKIPSTMPLPLGQLLGAGPAPPPRYPFDAERTRYYYLARNGIWHGLDALGLKHGDEVLMPAYHHGVELQTLLAKGLRLRFYRISEAMVADPDDVRAALGPETRALYVTHYLGFPQPIGMLKRIAAERGIPLIEDCALSLFSRSADGPLGTTGDISIFCLYKSLPVPHGGVLAVNRADVPLPTVPRPPDRLSTTSYLVHRMLDGMLLSRDPVGRATADSIRSLARVAKHAAGATVTPIDTEELDRSMIDVGIRDITRRIIRRTDADAVVSRRRANYLRFAERLDPGVRPVFRSLPDGACPLSYPILVRNKLETAARFLEAGIETVNMWSRHHPASPAGSFPEIDFLREHVLELPNHQGMRREHVDYVAEKANVLARW